MKKKILTFGLVGCMISGMLHSTVVYAAENAEINLENEIVEDDMSVYELPSYYNGFQYRIKEDGTVKISFCSGKSGTLAFPSEIEGKKVTEIDMRGEEDFDVYYDDESDNRKVNICGNATYANSVTEVIIPEGVEKIGDYAFNDFRNLTKVNMANSVTSIGKDAFAFCEKLEDITLSTSLKNIDSGAFYRCSNLKSIYIPSQVDNVGSLCGRGGLDESGNHRALSITGYAFGRCRNLVSIEVDSENAFFSSVDGILFDKEGKMLICCPGGKTGDIKVPNGVIDIKTGAFLQCEGITGIDVSGGVTNIENDAFYGCSSLINVAIPDSVTSLGIAAFAYCENLSNFNLPSGIKYLNPDLFHGCISLTEIVVPNGVWGLGRMVFAGSGLESITLPDSVKKIGEGQGYEDEAFSQKVTIYCNPGSYAETFAKENDYKYEHIKADKDDEERNKLTTLYLDKSILTFDEIGTIQALNVTVTPATQLSQVTWSTSNEKVATVKDGAVTAKGNGTATITASLGDKTAAATVTVSQKCKKVTMTLNGQAVNGTLKAKVGKTYNFKTIVTPQNADKKNAKITWATSNKKIATVKNGKVSVKKSGAVTITAKTADGKTSKIKLKAGKQKVKVSKVKITGNKTMKVKGKQTLNLTVTPATADNTKVSWSSSNKKIVAVDSKGKVTAKKKGTATITAKAKDGSGKKASFKIRVK